MSLNQSRVEKSEAQARKPGRPGGSGHQSGDSGGGGKRAGGGSAPPPPSSFSSSSYSVNHPPPASRRKFGNVEGGYSRVNSNSASPELRAATVSTRDVLDGGHAQASSHGSPDVLGPGAANPTDSSASRNYRGLPRPPPSQSSAEASLSATPETPAKGGTSKAFALQFGSISPGLIPARTSSAPPNLDEQKHEQALHNTFQVIPAPLVPSVPKEQCQQSVKDVVASNHHNEEDSQPSYQAKRVAHVQVPSVPSMAMQKPSVPAPGVSLPIGFQQPQIPIQFTGTSPLMQPNGITGSPLQIPLSLSMGNAQVQQHIFVPSVPSHILPQGIHQGIGFAQQIGNQLASHMGIGLPLPYAQQQAGMLASVRKTPVRITHPDTHEELKFDRIRDSCLDAASLGKQPPSNVPSQTQPIPSYTPSRQTNHHQPLHPASYNPGAFFVPTPPSLPFASIPVTSGLQAARHGYQIGQSGTAVSFMKPQMLNHMPVDNASSQLHDISEPVSLGHSHDLHSVPVCAPSAPLDVTGKPAVFSTVDKAALPVVTVGLLDKEEVPNLLKPPQEGTTTPQQRGDGASISESCAQQPKSVLELPGVVSLSDKDSPSSSISLLHSTQGMQPNMPPRSPASVVDCASFISSADSGGKDSLEGTDLLEDQQTMPTNKGILQSQQRHQSQNSEEAHVIPGAGEASTFIPCVPSPVDEHGNSFGTHLPSNDVDKYCVPLESSSIAIKEVLQYISPSMLGLSETAATDLGIGSLETSNFCDIKANGIVSKRVCPSLWPKQDYTHTEVETKLENMVDEEHGKIELFDNSSQGSHNAPGPVIPEQMEFARGGAADVNLREDAVSKLEPIEKEQIVIGNETTSCRLDVNKEAGSGWNVSKPACMEDSITDVPKSEPVGMEGAMLSHLLSVNSHVDETSSLDALNNDNVIGITDDGVIGITGNQEASLTDTAMVSSGVEPSRSMNLLEITKKLENAGQVLRSSGSAAFLERKKRPSNEVTKMKKEKRKQVLSKADATGINTDLYMAYIGPEEKREPLLADSNKVAACDTGESPIPNVGEMKHEVEHDDWEDAADISTPRLKTSENGELACGKKKFDVEYGNGAKSKKYSRDFLLTFRKQYTDLPVGFEIGQDIADILMGGQANTPDISDRKPFPSAGRVIDRPNGAIRDRRLVGLDDGKWTKASTPFIIGRDMRADLAIFRSGHGANVGVLRDHHVQSSPCDGGILAGPISLGGISRSNADADRWQRGPGVQGGPVPSPQTPKQVMHKAEKKYEVGKISDEEEAKQRQLKAILNKLTPQNFDRLFEQVKEVKIDNAVTLTGVISQIFDKALMEPTFCEMYANFCFHLAGVLPDFTEGGEKFTFKRLLLNKCQEEFERGEREQDEANRAEEGELNQSAQGREEKKIKARRRMLGNIRLIGELYKKKMPTERIMHECIQKLLGQYHNPDEEDLESLCKLMSTIGEMIDHPKAKEHMDAYFDMMTKLSTSQKLSSRVRFMLRDAIDLRRNRWQQRRKVEGPKKIEEVHRDAAQERQTQASRSARGPGIGSSRRGPPPADYCSRGSMLSSPSSKLIGVSSNSPFLGHVFGTQNIRLEDRHLFESRTTSVPLPHRPNEENPITLGPQGNLGRGMSIRGQPLMPTFPLSDVSSKSGDLQRMGLGLNGYGSRNELVPRYIQERHSGAPCESSKTDGYEHNPYLGGRVLSSEDSGLDTSSAATSPADQGPMSLIGSKNAPSEPKPFSEECLQEKSLSTIREFYSAKDEKEVVLCVRELNSPSFYPAMVSLWVTDSFERKDVDRESLAKLLVSLSKPQDSLLTQGQLIQGFESVLFSLEDTVTDAPRAAEFLGGIFAKVILADAISLKEIGRLIQHGGEEPGRLLVIGLASEVLGSTLDNIKTQKGDTVFNEIRLSFNLQLEDFQPPHPIKSRKLDAFL